MKKPAFDAAKVLRTVGYRATPARIRLLEVLARERRPMTVDHMYKKIGHSRVNEVTLYRAIEALASAGIVRRVNVQHGSAQYYELADEHHHHIVCTGCGAVEDVDACVPDTLAKSVARESREFTHISSHALEFFGTCKSCTYA